MVKSVPICVHPCAKKNIEIRVIQAITPHWSVDPEDMKFELFVFKKLIRMVNPLSICVQKNIEICAIRVQNPPSAW